MRAASCPCSALLPAGVAWPPALLPVPVVSYTTFSPSPPCSGCMFLWPCPAGCPVPGFPRRSALRSADFPRSSTEVPDRDRPASLRRMYHTFSWSASQPGMLSWHENQLHQFQFSFTFIHHKAGRRKEFVLFQTDCSVIHPNIRQIHERLINWYN